MQFDGHLLFVSYGPACQRIWFAMDYNRSSPPASNGAAPDRLMSEVCLFAVLSAFSGVACAAACAAASALWRLCFG